MLTTTESETMNVKKIPPLHLGIVLYEEFLQPLKISQNQDGPRSWGVPSSH